MSWEKYYKKWERVFYSAKLMLADAIWRDTGGRFCSNPDDETWVKVPWHWEYISVIPVKELDYAIFENSLPSSAFNIEQRLSFDRYYIDGLLKDRMVTEIAVNKWKKTIYYKMWRYRKPIWL